MKHLYTILVVLLLTSSLSAQDPEGWEWVQQNPNFTLVDLYDVDMLADGTGLAVGEKGQVYFTSNFGEDWGNLEQINFNTLTRAEIYQDGNDLILFAISTNKVHRSTDNGQSWQSITVTENLGFPTFFEVLSTDIYLYGGQNGFAKTTDGGQSWLNLSPGDGSLNFTSIDFINEDQGWAGTNNGDVYGTSDGGLNWDLLNTGNFDEPFNLSFWDENLGYAGHLRDLLKTTDGGNTWEVITVNAFGSNVYDVEIMDAERVIFPQGNRVFRTVDSGETATIVFPSTYSNRNRAAATLPDGRVWVASSFVQIAFSDDVGLNYSDQIPGVKTALRFVDFEDTQYGILGGFDGTLLQTNDGGNTWENLSDLVFPTYESVNDGFIAANDEFYLAVDQGVIHTTDGGQNWELLLDTPGDVYVLETTTNALFAGDRSDNVYRSLDAGMTWTTTDLLPDINANVNGMDFPDDQTGFVVGRNGLAYRTTDGGDNWTAMTMPTENLNYSFVYFRNNLEGYIGVDNFSTDLFYTTDGGDTWTTVTLPASTLYQQMYFHPDSDIGYVAGGSSGNGRILITLDGGATWELFHNSSEFFADMSVIITEQDFHIWVVGTGGLVEKGTLLLVNTNEPSLLPLTIGPNPTMDLIQVQLPSDLSSSARFYLYHTDGRFLGSHPARPSLDFSHLPPATYQLLLIDGEQRYSTRIIKM